MTHPLLAPNAWGSRYTNALNSLLDAWTKALEKFDGTTAIDMAYFTREFVESPHTRPFVAKLVYNIRSDMDEVDVEEMLLDLGVAQKITGAGE